MNTEVEEKSGCCSVVDGYDCEAPANTEPSMYVKSKCFCCGDFVCMKCSRRRKYYKYGIVRLCMNCIREKERKG